MMVYINYISAVFRLKELEKSVTMLGGEREAPVEVVAQRDFVKLEKEYFGEECVKMNIILVMATAIGAMVWIFYYVNWVKYA